MSAQAVQKTSAGRPKVASDLTVKSTITFLNNHIVFLDRLSTEIRENSMAIVDRGALIRAFISSLQESRIDLRHMTSEEEIRMALTKKLSI